MVSPTLPNYFFGHLGDAALCARVAGGPPKVDASDLRVAGSPHHKVIMINDVARAFFEAPARRHICVELLAEAKGAGEKEEPLQNTQV